ncbi:helix-turn-helix domain-containing protein [Phenylobacterium sp.]|uniref:helix-turn-helix domain-containing protein n=1 Tax=Phenylobacterium sp. TaxID=1871053 RepID=UPI002FDAA12E
MPHEQYQTVKEVAERLKVSEATVRHWIRDQALRAVDVGKGWRIADIDLAAFLNRHETMPRPDSGTREAGQ